MAEKKKNIIDSIGNTLRGGELPVGNNEWAAISKKMKFWDFFIPRFSSFNIYYLSAIVAAAVITAYAATKESQDTKEEMEKHPVETLLLQTDSLVVEDTIEIKPEFEKKIETPEPKHREETRDIEKQDSKKETTHKNKDASTIETKNEFLIQEAFNPYEEQDSLNVEESKEPDKTKDEKLDDKRKIQYIYQSDTIVIHDTIEKKVKKKKFIIDR